MCQRTFGIGGVLWALKHQQGVLDDVNVRVAVRREWATHSPFVKPNLRTSFERHRVAIETTDGRVVEERLQPRDSFVGHGVDTPWDQAATEIGRSGVSDALYDQARAQFTEKELVDVTVAVIAINAWNRLAVTFWPAVGNYKPAVATTVASALTSV